MAIERVAASTMTLYAEALDQALLAERSLRGFAALPGSLTTKEIGARRYLYWQVATGGKKKQHYIGPDTPEVRRTLAQAKEKRESFDLDLASLERMAQMLAKGGLQRESTAVGTVLELLAGFGLFRRGALLVGTQAFRVYGNLLGVRLQGDFATTSDLEIAAAAADERPALVEGLAKLDFLPVPELDPGAASVSYKVRGKELRVDFLTTKRGKSTKPVEIPGLGFSAQPLEFLDYLIGGDPVDALVLGRTATRVRLPDPARFAFHKLWTAAHRATSYQSKSNKDRRQAAALLEVLAEDRPAALQAAWEALAGRSGRTAIRRELKRLGPELGGLGLDV